MERLVSAPGPLADVCEESALNSLGDRVLDCIATQKAGKLGGCKKGIAHCSGAPLGERGPVADKEVRADTLLDVAFLAKSIDDQIGDALVGARMDQAKIDLAESVVLAEKQHRLVAAPHNLAEIPLGALQALCELPLLGVVEPPFRRFFADV